MKILSDIFSALRKSYAVVTGGMAIAAFLIPADLLNDYNYTVKLKYLIIIWLGLYTIVATLIQLSRNYYKQSFILPKVKWSKKEKDIDDVRNYLLLLESSELLSIGFYVSIFYPDNEYEKLIGVGYVQNIQDNGLLQVISKPLNDSDNDIWEKIGNNNSTVLPMLIVKPSIHFELIRQGII